jgi:hypothetical protein
MNDPIERDLGVQPLSRVMAQHGLKSQDLVNASTQQISFKMVARAVKGRRLTPHIQIKILNALNKAAKKNYSLKDIFNY